MENKKLGLDNQQFRNSPPQRIFDSQAVTPNFNVCQLILFMQIVICTIRSLVTPFHLNTD